MYLESSMKVTWVPRHDEEYDSIRSIGVVIINQSTNNADHTIIARKSPA